MFRLSSIATAAIAGAVAMSAFAQPPLPAPEQLPEHPQLPDPFSMMDGTKITTAEEWRTKRRPELVQLVQHYMYGFAPEVEGIEVQEDAPEALVLEGKARLKQVGIRIKGLDNSPTIHLAVFLPAEDKGPFPVFLAINKQGNHEAVPDEAVLINEGRHYEGDPVARNARGDFWCVPYIISRGYAFATFRETDIDPDTHDLSNGIHALYPNLPWAPENRWATIRAWAWGYHRCVDYLVTDKDIDAKRIAVTGHSRRGKTALLAAALDERIALAVPHQSGTGGCALSRDNDQETVKRINTVFPHWFNDAFTAFNDNEARIPFDQHLLMALIAPRALLDTEGAQDHWANPDSALRAMEAARPVWDLLGNGDPNVPLMVSEAAKVEAGEVGPCLQLRLDHKHTLNQDYWVGILNYADAWL
jgi:hypothetical protein